MTARLEGKKKECRSPLWLLWVKAGSPILIHKRSGHILGLHSSVNNGEVQVLLELHFFDAWRLEPCLKVPSMAVRGEITGTETQEAAEDAASEVKADDLYS